MHVQHVLSVRRIRINTSKLLGLSWKFSLLWGVGICVEAGACRGGCRLVHVISHYIVFICASFRGSTGFGQRPSLKLETCTLFIRFIFTCSLYHLYCTQLAAAGFKLFPRPLHHTTPPPPTPTAFWTYIRSYMSRLIFIIIAIIIIIIIIVTHHHHRHHHHQAHKTLPHPIYQLNPILTFISLST